MADLIDRKKIKEKFEPWLRVQGYSEGELNMLKAVLYEITIMPSAERHGLWIEENGFVFCSLCGDPWGTDTCDMVKSFNYCPNCGARMGEVAQ